MRAEFISHIGVVRENNEDAVFCDPKAGLLVIADGIGGSDAGEVASATAVRVVAENFWENPESEPAELMREAFYQANDILYRAGHEDGRHGMGTTMTAVAICDEQIKLVHVGDSRAYLLRKDHIEQLTDDHTLVNILLAQGKITDQEAENHPQRHILVRSIGQDLLVQVQEKELTWQKGDYLLLCTDGLYSLVPEKEMQTITERAVDLKHAVDMMAKTAINRGGYDNISIILAAFE